MSEMFPVPLDLDLSTAAIQRVRDFPLFAEMVGDGLIGTEADDAAPLAEKLAGAWLFQGLDREGRPFRDPEGSGRAVIVLSERREWATANAHNTASFPALQLLIYADSTRDRDPASPSYGAPLLRDADRKCKHIFNRLDRLLHSPANTVEDQRWSFTDPDGVTRLVHVHSLLRGSPFTIGDVPGTNEFTVRGEAVYNSITD